MVSVTRSKREVYDKYYKTAWGDEHAVGWRKKFTLVPMTDEDLANFRKQHMEKTKEALDDRIAKAQSEIRSCEREKDYANVEYLDPKQAELIEEAKGKASHCVLTPEEIEYFEKEDEKKEELNAVLEAATADPLFKKVLEDKLGDL